ncbi:MAG: HIT family protein [Clostridia bacterium]|nr:HIT family protein [Clostridia bacterium]
MCIFCKIISGEIPSYKIYEDENVYAFLDIADDIEGHTVVVPKEHCENLLDVSEETLSKVMLAVRKISKHYVDNCGYDGVNLLNNSGKCAEQSVFHLHIHILPRKDNDGKRVYPELVKLNSDMAHLCDKLKLN